MRSCSSCHKPDRPILTDRDCACGVGPDPTEHLANCKSLAHSVVFHLVRFPAKELTTAKTLSSYYVQRGWSLVVDGDRHYRGKLLCQDCIDLELDALARQREYKRACEAAMGNTRQTYAQMVSQAT